MVAVVTPTTDTVEDTVHIEAPETTGPRVQEAAEEGVHPQDVEHLPRDTGHPLQKNMTPAVTDLTPGIDPLQDTLAAPETDPCPRDTPTA